MILQNIDAEDSDVEEEEDICQVALDSGNLIDDGGPLFEEEFIDDGVMDTESKVP
jgi:hypothetical protein